MKRHSWTPIEDAGLCDLYPSHSAAEIAVILGIPLKSIQSRASKRGLKKSREWIAERARQRSLKPEHGGQAHRFTPGLVPWNKGTHWTAGGRSAETRFKPGHLGGNAAQLYQPIGAERINKDGYRERKINDDLPMQRRWRGLHIVLWEAENGPLPKGHAIVFMDGDKTHITLDNLELVSRAELMRRNTLHRYGKEIAGAYQLKGALTRQINRRNAA